MVYGINELPRRKQRGINHQKGFYHFNVASDGVLNPMLRNKHQKPAIINGLWYAAFYNFYSTC
jgi:hypothetical protein